MTIRNHSRPAPAAPARSGGPDDLVVVFDLDGTLVDSAPDLADALNAALREDGRPPLPFETARRFIGRGARSLVSRGYAAAGAALEEDALDGRLARFLELYAERLTRRTRPYPGVVAALERLAAQGARLAVCTNKPTGFSIRILDELGLLGRFAAVVGADAAPRRKPDPSHLFAALEAAGARAGAPAVLVGDSETDLETARRAAVPIALVTFGYSDRPVRELSPDAVIDDFGGLDEALAAALAAGGLAAPCPSPGPRL